MLAITLSGKALRVLAMFCLVSLMSLIAYALHDESEEIRERQWKRLTSEGYKQLVQLIEAEPKNKRLYTNLIDYFHSFQPNSTKLNTWARSEFFGQIIRLRRTAKMDAETKQLFSTYIIPELRAGLEDVDELVRFQAVSAAGRFGEISYPLVLLLVSVMRNHGDEGSGLLAPRALGEIGPLAHEALPALEQASKYSESAKEAIQRISKSQPGEEKKNP